MLGPLRGLKNCCVDGKQTHEMMLSITNYQRNVALLVAQTVKNPPAMKETQVQSLGWEVSLEKGTHPGEGNGHRLQYSCLDNSMDKGTWQATVHGGHTDLDMTE